MGPWSRHKLEWNPDEVYRVPTADGAAILLGRWRPRSEPSGLPVILAHGLGANRFDLDFDDTLSVARHLARQGREAWVLELRGRGLAGKTADATFDAQAEHDVAAALGAVLATGPKAVAWVGHSKGGLLALAHLARHPDAPIRALVTLGTPFSFAGQPGLARFLGVVSPALTLKVLPLKAPARLASAWGLPPVPFGDWLLNRENVEPKVIQQALANLAEDVLGGVARQFHRWVTTGSFDANDGFDYRAALANVKVPLLAFAGSKDLLAPPDSVAAIAKSHGGPVELVVLSKANGFQADYGHGDLTIGRHAPVEVYPRIVEFLDRHAGG